MPIVSFDKFTGGQPLQTQKQDPSQLRREIEGDTFLEHDPTYADRVKALVERRGAEAQSIISGEGDNAGKSDIRRGAEAFAQVSGAVPETAFQSLPEWARKGLGVVGAKVGQGFKALTDAISSNPELQKWTQEHPETAKFIEDTAGTGAAVGQVAGDILLEKGLADAGNFGVTKVKDVTGGAIDKVNSAIPDVKLPNNGTGLSDALTQIDKPTESVLNPTRLIPKDKLKDIPLAKLKVQATTKEAKLDSYVKISKDAAVDYSKPTALVKAGEKGGEALNVIGNKMAKQAQLKNAALGEVGGKTVKNIATVRANMRDLLRDRVGVNIVKKDGRLAIEDASGRISKVAFDPADNKLMTDAYRVLAKLGKSPTVRQVDDTVDALQDLLYKRKSAVAVPVNGQVEGVLKQVTGTLNRAVKKIGGEQYTKANAKYAYYVDTYEKLNKALGAEGVRGGTLMKSLFSPSGEAPRRLFAEVKKLTGIDLVEEATLAKFAMESIGDARQASLLEEVIRGGVPTPTNFVGKAVDKLLEKAKDPIGKAKRIINEKPKP